ncbi:3-oxoacyl-[acyl-carrier-protein] synthase III C-terminal domain-containing protein [Actinacidiphila sp. ITFR-21]|uniref:3-oxoacyl-[acyl-carrier-protein] synthase III C-terminal domain-containing protein n=1 Tax=Actinacidiphila sp. ITFR-21 TaxID=3075199 RepID=UPI00288AF12D|nr:3-oxoacyl-[acyl-carrier-protein] synthase III C-terminal domain-containing protein [Streptomyces sp. ITFR-21]WNI18954.1 3-oxoacyl-[acyl-carrier-protein] synthase III C-terminal domain-containing protein [Streptomyces sp. ITFR-21]
MTTGLSRIAVRLPSRMEPVDDVLTRLDRGVTERKMFAKVYGLQQSPTLADGERTEDLLAEAGRAALDGGTAGLVLYGHTLLTQEFGYRGGFPDRLRAELGLPGARFYGLSHINCTSVLRSIELGRRFLARPGADPDDRVLVLGGDHGSINDRSRFVPGMTVGGDGVVAFMVHRTGPGRPARFRYLSGAAGRDARFHSNLRMTAEEFALFGKVCAEQAVVTVRRAAHEAGLGLGDIDWVMPHLSNRMFWRTFSSESGIPKDRICLDLIPRQGHNFGADALMALDHADRTGRLRPGDRCALVSLGQGAYFQAFIFEVAED